MGTGGDAGKEGSRGRKKWPLFLVAQNSLHSMSIILYFYLSWIITRKHLSIRCGQGRLLKGCKVWSKVFRKLGFQLEEWDACIAITTEGWKSTLVPGTVCAIQNRRVLHSDLLNLLYRINHFPNTKNVECQALKTWDFQPLSPKQSWSRSKSTSLLKGDVFKLKTWKWLNCMSSYILK